MLQILRQDFARSTTVETASAKPEPSLGSRQAAHEQCHPGRDVHAAAVPQPACDATALSLPAGAQSTLQAEQPHDRLSGLFHGLFGADDAHGHKAPSQHVTAHAQRPAAAQADTHMNGAHTAEPAAWPGMLHQADARWQDNGALQVEPAEVTPAATALSPPGSTLVSVVRDTLDAPTALVLGDANAMACAAAPTPVPFQGFHAEQPPNTAPGTAAAGVQHLTLPARPPAITPLPDDCVTAVRHPSRPTPSGSSEPVPDTPESVSPFASETFVATLAPGALAAPPAAPAALDAAPAAPRSAHTATDAARAEDAQHADAQTTAMQQECGAAGAHLKRKRAPSELDDLRFAEASESQAASEARGQACDGALLPSAVLEPAVRLPAPPVHTHAGAHHVGAVARRVHAGRSNDVGGQWHSQSSAAAQGQQHSAAPGDEAIGAAAHLAAPVQVQVTAEAANIVAHGQHISAMPEQDLAPRGVTPLLQRPHAGSGPGGSAQAAAPGTASSEDLAQERRKLEAFVQPVVARVLRDKCALLRCQNTFIARILSCASVLWRMPSLGA